VAAAAIAVGFTSLAVGLDMTRLPVLFIPWLVALLVCYFLCVQLIKKLYVRRYGEWM
jgi:Mg2+-importing ATPase